MNTDQIQAAGFRPFTPPGRCPAELLPDDEVEVLLVTTKRVRMRASKVPWVGPRIPAHWTVAGYRKVSKKSERPSYE